MLRTSYLTSIPFALSDLEKKCLFYLEEFFLFLPRRVKSFIRTASVQTLPTRASPMKLGIEITYLQWKGTCRPSTATLWLVCWYCQCRQSWTSPCTQFSWSFLERTLEWNIIPNLYVMKCSIGCTFNIEFGERRIYLAFGVSILFTRCMYVKL